MHDGVTVTLRDAILRHAGEADQSVRNFKRLPASDQNAILDFLKSL